ncbi:hypothetical protein GGS20DRAFT_530722 [Poronia punctata]|nr:hypothetical protein GGS20DRAFT_530722 [Poronia punctata]
MSSPKSRPISRLGGWETWDGCSFNGSSGLGCGRAALSLAEEARGVTEIVCLQQDCRYRIAVPLLRRKLGSRMERNNKDLHALQALRAGQLKETFVMTHYYARSPQHNPRTYICQCIVIWRPGASRWAGLPFPCPMRCLRRLDRARPPKTGMFSVNF